MGHQSAQGRRLLLLTSGFALFSTGLLLHGLKRDYENHERAGLWRPPAVRSGLRTPQISSTISAPCTTAMALILASWASSETP